MRPREDELIDPEIAEQLDAIDATLAGDPVDPRFAELAELALMLAANRPEAPRPEFADALDRRVEARFRRVEPRVTAVAPGASRGGRGGRARRWRLTPAWGAAGTALAAVVIGVAVVSPGGGTSGTANVPHALLLAPLNRASSNSSAQSLAPTTTPAPAAKSPINGQNPTSIGAPPASRTPTAGTLLYGGHGAGSGGAASAGSSSSASPTVGSNGSAVNAASPSPLPNGRKIVQSSSLQLGAKASRIDTVAQEVFGVVGAVQGIVDSSNVASTGGPGASAQFQLRIPSGSLAQALSELSQLPHSKVLSRIDSTQDINSSFVSTRRQIADANAALAGLRLKLAAATTQTEINTLNAQIAGERATLRQARASLRSLNRRVDYSRVYLTITADGVVPPPAPQSGGFGLHQAGHDALRVLEVSAGVALIALAVLLPAGLLAALGWWFGSTVQRRRRERALDLA